MDSEDAGQALYNDMKEAAGELLDEIEELKEEIDILESKLKFLAALMPEERLSRLYGEEIGKMESDLEYAEREFIEKTDKMNKINKLSDAIAQKSQGK